VVLLPIDYVYWHKGLDDRVQSVCSQLGDRKKEAWIAGNAMERAKQSIAKFFVNIQEGIGKTLGQIKPDSSRRSDMEILGH
jgi:hypothetical protein